MSVVRNRDVFECPDVTRTLAIPRDLVDPGAWVSIDSGAVRGDRMLQLIETRDPTSITLYGGHFCKGCYNLVGLFF